MNNAEQNFVHQCQVCIPVCIGVRARYTNQLLLGVEKQSLRYVWMFNYSK